MLRPRLWVSAVSLAPGAAFLDLTAASNGVVRNLRVVCANQGITTPA